MAGKGIDRVDDIVKPFAEHQFLLTHLSAHSGGEGASQ